MIYIIFKFIADNYLSIFSLLCLLFIAFGDKRLGLQERRFVAFFVVSIALLCLNDYIDYTIGHIPHSQYWWIRSIASTICYIIRPIILFAELHLVGNLSKRLYIIAFILLAFNTFIFATSFWTQWTFIINSDNIFIRGPLGLLSHIIAIFFMTILIISILKKHNDLDTMEQLALLFLNISITLGAIIDSITYNNSLHLTIVLAFIIYYLIVYVHHSNKVLNAREEELEAKRNALMLSQIHPHFIYNTLNVIYYLCRTDSQKAANAVLNFSEYLHTTLEFSLENNLIPIEKELELARNYTYLEKIRFEDLEIIFDIQDEGYMIPPLSIQPIVENALDMGFMV